jgi:hypothetical protein
MVCVVCGFPILSAETPVPVDPAPEMRGGELTAVAVKGFAHEHCADPEDAMAAGVWEPGEDYPHGDY